MPVDYTTQPGDCIASIAFRHGFFPDTIWNHPENAALKRLRGDPNVLLAGDEVKVPDLRVKEVACAPEECHRFKRKGVPEKLRIRIEDEQGMPIADTPYEIIVDGKHSRGTTDGDGWIIESIPPDAREGTLLVGEPGQEQEHALKLGHLDPIDELTGVQARLKNLGYDCLVTGRLDEETREAVKQFQLSRELEPTGEPDDVMREKLVEAHKS